MRERRLRVLFSDARGRTVPAGGLGAWLTRVAPPGARGTVNVALVTDLRMRALNRRYCGKDYATDVLSFAATPDATRQGDPSAAIRLRRLRVPGRARPVTSRQPPATCLGDVVIARGVAARQAREAGHGESTEFRILALHGLLHLLGYDHERDEGQMGRTEQRLRRRGGLPEGLIERG